MDDFAGSSLAVREENSFRRLRSDFLELIIAVHRPNEIREIQAEAVGLVLMRITERFEAGAVLVVIVVHAVHAFLSPAMIIAPKLAPSGQVQPRDRAAQAGHY